MSFDERLLECDRRDRLASMNEVFETRVWVNERCRSHPILFGEEREKMIAFAPVILANDHYGEYLSGWSL